MWLLVGFKTLVIQIMARSTKDEVKALMKGLDLLHIKFIHIWMNNQFLENDRYEEYLEMLNEWEIDGYYECYNWLLHCNEESPEKDKAVESANRVLTDFLSVWRRKARGVYEDVLSLMAYCAQHQFINMTPTLKERIDADWKEMGTDEDKEELYNSLLPYPMELYKMFQEEKYEEAFANIYYLFQRLSDLDKRRPEMFRHVDSYVPKMELISDLLREAYFQIKGCPDVSADMKSDIDFFILVLQGENMYFAENDSRWDDMFDDENRYYGHLGDFWEW